VSDPDTHIAERLSGHAPFMATDHFVEPSVAEPSPAAIGTAPDAAPTDISEDVPEPKAAPAPRVQQTNAPPVEIDLTTLLGDLEGAPTMTPPDPPEGQNLDEVFRDFRDEVSRQTGAEDAAQHLKLARTYLEMGMADEAIGSLETAARSPKHRFEAAAMLGRLYRDQQDIAHAIEWLERAAEAPAAGLEEGRALLYDLGATLEIAGEAARALAVFMELQADAGEYRDVSARVNRLARVQTGG
jgi:tetratricopeptide (TPR) repeat protein